MWWNALTVYCEAIVDYYYKTGEEYINCGNCGYHYSATIKDTDKLLTELTQDDSWSVSRFVDGKIEVEYGDGTIVTTEINAK